MKKTLLTIALITIITARTYSQFDVINTNKHSTPSPEAMSLSKGTENSNVDLYTGTFNYSALLKEVDLAGLKLQLGLNYSTNGFKVQDLPGSTGLGWNPSFGGVINRYLAGSQDEGTLGYCGPNSIGNKNSLAFSNSYFDNVTKGDWDTQPDEFTFSFFGYSGIMMLDPNGNPLLKSSKDGLIVEYCPFNKVNGRSANGPENWVIRDQKGNKFIFGDQYTETSSHTFHGEKENKLRTFISSWYLKKVITSSNQVIELSYNTGSPVSYTNYTNVSRYSEAAGTACTNGNPQWSYWNENIDILVNNPQYLNSISCEGTSIHFDYNLSRLDLANGRILTDINIKWQNTTVNKYKLEYGYFVSDDGTSTKRLKLGDIVEQSKSGNLDKVLYRFRYNESVNLPARNSIKTDYFGYYNSNPYNNNIYAYDYNFWVDTERSKANTLTAVVNETGGILYIEYEQNNLTYEGNNYNYGGVRTKKIFYKLNDSSTEIRNSEEYNYNNPNSNTSSAQKILQPWASEHYFSFICNSHVYYDTYFYSQPLIKFSADNSTWLGYSYVSIKKTDGSLTRYKFTNTSEYPDTWDQGWWSSSSGTSNGWADLMADNPTSLAYARGKVLSEEVINSSGDVVYKNSYAYSLLPSTSSILGIKACVSSIGYTSTNGQITSYIPSYSFGKSRFSANDLRLDSKTETYYNNGVPITTVNNYNYVTGRNANYLLRNKTTTQSNQKVAKVTYRYPFDVLSDLPSEMATASLPYTYMVQKNMWSIPIETIYSVSQFGDEKITAVNLMKYTGNGPDAVVPLAEYSLETKYPLPVSNYQNYTSVINNGIEEDVMDARLKPKITYNYDSKGNILQQATATSPVKYHSYISGYSDKYTVAEVSNAPYTSIYQNNFEEQTDFDANLSLDNTNRHTGMFSGRINNSNSSEIVSHSGKWLNISLTSPKKFLYSGWIYSNGPSAQIFLFMKRDGETGYYSYVDDVYTDQNGKWVYVEKVFEVPADVTLLNLRVDNNGGGTVWFDDLRLHPADAEMITSTYEPLVGISSKTDAKNVSSLYDYDEFNRLKNISDQNKNILKNFSYNNSNNLPGAAANWQNSGNTDCETILDPYFSRNMNTGMTQIEQVDTNPYSPTYNLRRWVQSIEDKITCPATYTYLSFVDSYYYQVTLKVKRSFNDFKDATYKFKVYYHTINAGGWGEGWSEALIDVSLASGELTKTGTLYLQNADDAEVELIEIVK